MSNSSLWSLFHFNPLHHEGGDISQSTASRYMSIFQSTPPRGWRQGSGGVKILIHNFNPLHHEGGDEVGVSRMEDDIVFQSTPPRGWRPPAIYCSYRMPSISIHSTTRVETSFWTIYNCNMQFQSTPPRGWRLRYMARMHCGSGFQSTPPRGWRP